MRVIADIAAAGSTAAELFAERSADGSAWTEPGVSAAPIPVIINAVGARKGSWIAIPTASAADLIWRVRGRSGNGIASPSVSKVHLQFRNAPLAPPATPPSGDLGSPIHDLNAETLALTHSDNQDVTTWPDDSVSNLDGAVVGGIAPKFRTSLWPGGKPCVQWSGANNKIAFSPPTNSSFTHYVVASGIDGGDVATVLEGNGYPKGKGISAIGTSEMGGFVNTHVWFPTYENVPDTWDMSTPHIYRFAFDYGIGHWWLFVDGVLVADNDCPPQITESTQMWVGDYGTGLGLSMLLARELCYDAPYSTAGLNSVETALKATWGTP
jgi:hypothetical protein